jgi:hypothetical protein
MGWSVPNEAITRGPHVQWNHVDGPLMSWAGEIHWLTVGQRIRVALGMATVDEIACTRWPYLARLRDELNASHAYAIAEPLGEGVTHISPSHTTTEEGE